MSSDEDWDLVTVEKMKEEENESTSEVKIEIGENKEIEIEIEKFAVEIEKKVDNLDKNKLLNEDEETLFCSSCIIPYYKGCKIS
tara:strand:- start:345 stop:596 length:252 start_codon:yes stop_codon:yes gene_type:complete